MQFNNNPKILNISQWSCKNYVDSESVGAQNWSLGLGKDILSFSLGTTLVIVLHAVYVFPTGKKGSASALYCVWD